MKEIGPRRGTRVCSAPLGSANDQFETNYSSIRTMTKDNLPLHVLYRRIELYIPKLVILQPTYPLSFYRSELLWFYQDGARHIYPDAWEEYLEPIPEVCDMCNPNKHIGDNIIFLYFKAGKNGIKGFRKFSKRKKNASSGIFYSQSDTTIQHFLVNRLDPHTMKVKLHWFC